MPKLIISAGHNSTTSLGVEHEGLKEFELTRKMLSLLLPHLDDLEIDYIAVPLDLDLVKRIDWINGQDVNLNNGDFFVELHVNDGGKSGVETWFRGHTSKNNRSEKIAKFIGEDLSSRTNLILQGVRSEYESSIGSLTILNKIKIPGILLELLYIDNQDDIRILTDEARLSEILKSLAASIHHFLKHDRDYIDEFDKAADSTLMNQLVLSDEAISNVKSSGIIDMYDSFNDENVANATPDSSTTSTTMTSNKESSNLSLQSPPQTNQNKSNSITHQSPSDLSTSNNQSRPKQKKLLSGEERKNMIVSTFKRILNRDPSENELKQYTDVAIEEYELITRLIDSEEFKENIRKLSELQETKEKLTQTQDELNNSKDEIKELKQLVETLKKQIETKNRHIYKVIEIMKIKGIISEGEYFDSKRIKDKAGEINKNNSDRLGAVPSISKFLAKLIK